MVACMVHVVDPSRRPGMGLTAAPAGRGPRGGTRPAGPRRGPAHPGAGQGPGHSGCGTAGGWALGLPYELELTNVTSVPQSHRVASGAGSVRGGHAPAQPQRRRSERQPPASGLPRHDGAGARPERVLLVTPAFSSRAALPQRLVHRLVVRNGGGVPDLPPRTVAAVAPALVDRRATDRAGDRRCGVSAGWPPPPAADSYHRRSVLPVNGARHLAQRFAIDWIQLEPDDRLVKGDPSRNSSFPQFGREVLAVADATVVHVQDGLPEGSPGRFAPGVSAANADGNSVVLDLGDGRFTLYAHLQPGSLRVRPGERVRRGQVLALLGELGQQRCPPSPLPRDGRPLASGLRRPPLRDRPFRGHRPGGVLHGSGRGLRTPLQPVPVRPVPGPSLQRSRLPADLQVVRFLP